MIASGKSPHVASNDIKISQHPELLTEKEQKYIEKKQKRREKRRGGHQRFL